MLGIFSAIMQFSDFLVKAAKKYADTPEGQAELYDVIQSLQGDEDPESDNQPAGEGK